jgi:hypothetical protein
MAIDWKSLTLDAIASNPDLVEDIKVEAQKLLDEKTALLNSKKEILDEQKKATKQLKVWTQLQEELGLEGADDAKELIMKGKTAGEPGEDQGKALQDLRTQLETERQNHKAAVTNLKQSFEQEKTDLQKAVSEKAQEFKRSIIAQKLHQAIANDFNRPEDGEYVLSREGYQIELEELPEDDRTPLKDRKLVLYKGGNTAIPFALDDALQSIKSDPSNQHYLKSTFVTGGGFNPGQRSQSADNPWITGNRTQQMLLLRDNPQRAEQLQKSAKLAGK